MSGPNVWAHPAHSRKRWWYAAGAAAVLCLVLTWLVLDPRTGALDPLAGKYESMALARLRGIDWANSPRAWLTTCERHLPLGLLGLELHFPVGTLLTFNIALWWVLLMRRLPLWGLYVNVSIIMMLLVGGKPRYFLMILPMLLIAWTLGVHWLSRRVGRRHFAAEWMTLLGLGVAIVPNAVRCAGFVLEQHGIDHTLARRGFLEVYRGGKMLPVHRMGLFIREIVPEGKKVIGPEPRITSLVSGRWVYGAAEVIGNTRPPESVRLLKKLNPDYLAYDKELGKDRLLTQIISHRLLRVRWNEMAGRPERYVAPVSVPQITAATRSRRLAPTRPATRPVTTQSTRP